LGVGFRVMDMQHLAYFLAILVGIVSSGIIGSAWELATGEDVRLRDILDAQPTIVTPLRVLAAVFSAPSKVLLDGCWWLIAQPLIGVPVLALGFGWSFMQGVVILTKVFGFP
jgi:hypothetical protein